MLTRDLLRIRKKGGFKPAFADVNSPALQELAAALITLFTDGAKQYMSREELDELALIIIRQERDTLLGDGLKKLLLDRCDFGVPQEVDHPSKRRELFKCSAQALAECKGDIGRYREALSAFGEFIAGDIYGDLPELERLHAFREISPQALLNRYNLALVQGMLLYADEVKLRVKDPNPAELRRVFKYLKFFRLLAELRQMPHGETALHISGPFSLFANTRKYALQLANFFPAVVNLAEWKLQAKIRLGNRTYKLELDHTSPLVSHYRNFSSYVPEEIRMFHKLFAQRSCDWKIIGDTPFLPGIKPELIFPDLSFRRESDGEILHLELFHRWHKGQLERRLEYLQEHPDIPLLLGIDRALADDSEFAALQERYPAVHCCRFRDFPGVERISKALSAMRPLKKTENGV